MTEILSGVEVGPAGTPAGTVLWLHGLGASGHDFEDVVPLLDLHGVRFVFPHAPRRSVTINGGLIMPAWYDIAFLGDDGGEDAVDVRESAQLIEALIAREKQRGVPASRLLLAGFSQGAAIALHVGARHPEPLLGIMVLSGYEVLAETRAAEESEANRATPLLFCHGVLDDMVSIDRGRRAFDVHAHPGRDAVWREFPIAHEVSMQEIHVIRDWLKERFRAPSATPATS